MELKKIKKSFYFLLSFLLIGSFADAQNQKTTTDSLAQALKQMTSKYESLKKTSDDWPDLSRYRAANNKLEAAAPEKQRVVFMGNSITDYWLIRSPEYFKKNPSYVDRGISGQTTPQMLIRFKPDVIDLDPKVVLILAGTNDIAGNTGPSTLKMIEDNLASMAQLGKTNGIKVILCSVLPAYNYPWKPEIHPVAKIEKLNRWIKNFAVENQMIYLDFYSSMVDSRRGMIKSYSIEGVHPNKSGYKVMEVLADKAIKKALAENK